MSEGSAAQPYRETHYGRIVEVHWNAGDPITIVFTGAEHIAYGDIRSSRNQLFFDTDIVRWIVVFPSADNLPVFALVTATGVFAGGGTRSGTNLNQITPVPTLAQLAGNTSYIPSDNDFFPNSAKDPGFAFHSPGQIPPFDFGAPITMPATNLITVGVSRLEHDAQSALNSLFNPQVLGDPGYRTYADIQAAITAFPPTQIRVDVHKGGTFVVDPFAGLVTVSAGTLLWTDMRSYGVFETGQLSTFNSAGFVA